jgi:integrase
MGFVVRRGTRDKPRYYIRYVDVDGTERTKRVPAKTSAEAEKQLHQAETNIIEGRLGMEAKGSVATAGALMDEWEKTLTNRDAHGDRGRLRKHVRPAFATVPMSRLVEIGPIMSWLDKQRAAGELSDGSIRHNLNLLSRFFSWAVERGYAKVNPVRQIPQGKRPKQATKKDQPWLREDGKVVELMQALAEPVNLMFYLGNRSGLRTGEICGLRMSDLAFLGDGTIRACKSYDGPLKEDKYSDGKVKWVPAPADWETFLGIWLKRRKLQGAKEEDLVFPAPPSEKRRREWLGYTKEEVEEHWEAAAEKCGVKLTWYQATRHSFVSRNLEAGASLDEVSAAVGHSSPVVTKRFYDHFVRKTFSSTLTAGLKR